MFPDAQGYPLAAAADAPVSIIPRGDWTTAGPDLAHIDLMNGVSRLTVHHTAGEIQTDAWLPTARELENIREFHAGTRPGDRKWADIAYHFAVDRAGRVWQARPLAEVFTHGELVETTCPGRILQGYMTRARAAWADAEHVAWQALPRPPLAAATRGRR
jgi:hypothetical protein